MTSLLLRCRQAWRALRPASAFISYRSHTSISGLVAELEYRGLLGGLTASHTTLERFLEAPRVLYCGVDPTAGSLHVGHLLPLLTLLHFQLIGHHAIALLGGATALIGDPSGRDEERPIQVKENVQGNTTKVENQLLRFFESAQLYAQKRSTSFGNPRQTVKMVNNLTWWHDFTLVDFLHSTGKLAKINSMLSKESVKSRMASSSGISFAEFSYQLLQAHDFWHLYKNYDCKIQVGGSDQWGNIVAGLDVISRRETDTNTEIGRAIGLTTPLLTTPSGQKFGKSAGVAIWLNPQKTSVFDFYQFFLRISDIEVEKYLKLLTLLGSEEINAVMRAHETKPNLRSAQHRLATEVTELVHGEAGVTQAHAATQLLFDRDATEIRPEDAAEALRHGPHYHTLQETELIGIHLTKLASSSGLTSSRSEAIRLVESGGLYLNNVAVDRTERKLQVADLLHERLAILRAGKDKHVVLVRK